MLQTNTYTMPTAVYAFSLHWVYYSILCISIVP